MNRFANAAGIGLHYIGARRRQRLTSRAQLLAHQQRQWARLHRYITRHSPFYAKLKHLRVADWPQLDKQGWMTHFDTINTRGITRQAAFAVAERAEHSRDFTPTIGPISIGLSTGTSGMRGLFLTSPGEQRHWVATVLAKFLPGGLLARERVALVLRAGNNLYDTLSGARLQFRFIDLLQPLDAVLDALRAFAPTILVGPARVLTLIADTTHETSAQISPERIISTAEVLDPIDRVRLEQVWGRPVEQIYQATEGFLGYTCRHGTLHLNEDGLLIEPDWLDAAHQRFAPIITDLYRTTQPVVRYRLNDILTTRARPCPCGSPLRAIEAIAGREDDIIHLPATSRSGAVPIFPDSLSRTLLTAAPASRDYQIDQVGDDTLRVAVWPEPDVATRSAIVHALSACCTRFGARPAHIEFTAFPEYTPSAKRRRVRNLPPCPTS